MKIILTFILLFINIIAFSQEPTLKDATDFLKEKIETMCTQSTSVFSVHINDCILDIFECIDTDTVNYYHLDLSEITDTIFYNPKEKFGKTRVTFKGSGCYMISYFSLSGDKEEVKSSNIVVLPFKTKGIDRIEFVNRIEKAALHAKKLCKPKF